MTYNPNNPVARYARAHPENVVWTSETGWQDPKPMHFHAGHHMPGYLPESDVYTFETFEGAKQATIDDIDLYGDSLFDGDMKDEADECSATMEDLNLESGPEWGAYVADLYYWITPCTDDCDTESESY